MVCREADGRALRPELFQAGSLENGHAVVFPGFYTEAAGESYFREADSLLCVGESGVGVHAGLDSLQRCLIFFQCGVTRVFAGGFEKSSCFRVVFLWLVCGEMLVKAGSLTVTFGVVENFHFFQIYFNTINSYNIS